MRCHGAGPPRVGGRTTAQGDSELVCTGAVVVHHAYRILTTVLDRRHSRCETIVPPRLDAARSGTTEHALGAIPAVISAAGFRCSHRLRRDEHRTYVSQLESTVPVISSLWTSTL